MYAPIPEQAVKMRCLAQVLRHNAQETDNSFYRRLFQTTAGELEARAEKLERADWFRAHYKAVS